MSQLADLKQVAGDAGHNAAGLVVVEVGEGQFLQMGEQKGRKGQQGKKGAGMMTATHMKTQFHWNEKAFLNKFHIDFFPSKDKIIHVKL